MLYPHALPPGARRARGLAAPPCARQGMLACADATSKPSCCSPLWFFWPRSSLVNPGQTCGCLQRRAFNPCALAVTLLQQTAAQRAAKHHQTAHCSMSHHHVQGRSQCSQGPPTTCAQAGRSNRGRSYGTEPPAAARGSPASYASCWSSCAGCAARRACSCLQNSLCIGQEAR